MTEPAAYPDPGELPVVDWVPKGLIDVDHQYQRPEDTARAAKIASSFSWAKFGAVVLVPDGDRYKVIDGQHRVSAAKLHPLVDHLPAVIMPAVKGVAAEATSFIGINAERKAVQGLELYHARLAAGDEDARTIANVAAKAGVSVPRYPGAKNPRETIAVSVLQAIIGRHGAMRARECLETLAKAEVAPITANHLKAVEHLMFDDEFAGWLDLDELASTIKTMGAAAETEAARFSATHCVPRWKGLANVLFAKCRKRRTPVANAAPAPAKAAETKTVETFPAAKAARKAVPSQLRPLLRPDIAQRAAEMVARNVPLPRANVTGSIMGDPEPGRSALDQRKAS